MKQQDGGRRSDIGERRLHIVDALRAVSILYIVGLWHLLEYAPALPHFQTPPFQALTTVFLGLFVFLSGLLVGRSEMKLRWAEVKAFYMRRVFRIYPLYLVALAVFTATGLTDLSTAIKSAFGLSMFAGPPPYTLWFVAMILWFYLAAPLLLACAGRGTKFLLVAGLFTAALGCAGLLLPSADQRMFVYFPVFAAGVWWSLFRTDSAPSKALSATACAGLCIVMMVFSTPSGRTAVVIASLLALSGAMSVFLWTRLLAPESGRARLLVFVSYASFAMYLFHRPILSWMAELFTPQTLVFQLSYLWLICLPVVILVAWIVQRAHDGLARSLRQEDGDRISEIGGRMSDSGGQRTEVGERKTDVGKRKTDDRGRRSEDWRWTKS